MVAVRLDAEDTTFAGAAEVALCDLAEGAAHAAHDYELVARSPVPLRDVGMTTFAVFRGGVASATRSRSSSANRTCRQWCRYACTPHA